MLQLNQGSHPAQQRLILRAGCPSGQFADAPCLYSPDPTAPRLTAAKFWPKHLLDGLPFSNDHAQKTV